MYRIAALTICACLLLTSAALAENSVTVTSKSVDPGASDVEIPILLENDVAVSAITVPLVSREITPGAFITTLSMHYDDRLPPGGPLELIRITNHYETEDGACKEGQPGGFGAVDYSDGGPHAVAASPEGAMFAAVAFVQNLTPGTDASGSLVLTVDITGTSGQFEIDTTCAEPANHLAFSDAVTHNTIVPSFSKGVITITGGGNSVTVISKPVPLGATDVEIPILISNEAAVMAVQVPLVIREVDPGSYITDLSMSYGERLPDAPGQPLSDIVITNQHSTPDGTCSPGGFGTDGPADFISPDGVLFARIRTTSPDLPAGADVTGSLLLTVDVTSSLGQFEIDTTCTDPNNHIQFNAAGSGDPIYPAFTKGTITIASPDNNVVVTSKTIMQGAKDVEIPILIENDIALDIIDVPLMIRAVTPGSFITSLGMSFDDRLPPGGPFDLQRFTNHYEVDDGNCKSGQPGGFATLSYSNGGPNPVVASPEGVMFVGIAYVSPLLPGSDATGSLVLTVDVNSVVGTFEIDTTCVEGGSDLHIQYYPPSGPGFTPFFTKGTITIEPRRVTSLADAGAGTLREAIEWANEHPGPDTIRFDVTGTIQLLTPLPALTDQTGGTFIDGFSAPGAAKTPYFDPAIILDGALLGTGSGITITDSVAGYPGHHIEGLAIKNFPEAGIVVENGAGWMHTFSANLIYNNGGLGIDLGGDGVTLNDPGDLDTGPNLLANYPEIDTVFLTAPDTFYVAGTSNGYLVELYLAEKYLGADSIADASGHGEAWQYLGEAFVLPPDGHFSTTVSAPAWSKITGITIDSAVNTSEFSPNRQLIPDSLIITVYSPVKITVIEPDTSDSIGPGFNTIGPTATYDSLTDYGVGPNGVPGELDDRVTITNVQEGAYIIKVRNDGSGSGQNYFCGIRVDGTEQAFVASNGSTGPNPTPLPVPDIGEEDEYQYDPKPIKRGDLDGDAFLTALDLSALIDVLFGGAPLPDPPALADLNCDGFPDALDLSLLIDHLFAGGPEPCF